MLADVDLEQLAEKLTGAALQPNAKTRREHRKYINSERAQRDSPENCPRCGAGLVERTNRKTGEVFWGCSRFPKCLGTRNV